MPLAVWKPFQHIWSRAADFPCPFKEHVTSGMAGTVLHRAGPPTFCKCSGGSLGWSGSVAALVKRVNLQRHQNCASVTCVRNETGLKGENNVKFCKSDHNYQCMDSLDWVWGFLFHNGPLKLSWKRPTHPRIFFFPNGELVLAQRGSTLLGI